MIEVAEGWAVVEGGKINVNTIFMTRRGAIVNWLIVGPPRMVLSSMMSDALIEEKWEQTRGDRAVVPVTIRVDAFADEWAKDDHPHATPARAPAVGARSISQEEPDGNAIP